MFATFIPRLVSAPVLVLAFVLAAIVGRADGQTPPAQTIRIEQPVTVNIDLGDATQVIVPQRRAFAVPPTPSANMGSIGEAVVVDRVRAQVTIRDQAATTTLDVGITNPGHRQVEAILLLPVPHGAVVTAFDFDGAASQPTAQVLARDDARRTYDGIVAKVRDPALLEFAGYGLVRSSVFPVAANGTQRIRLTYEHLLPVDGDRVDFILPRSEALDANAAWEISVDVESHTSISTLYSPSHELSWTRLSPGHLAASLKQSGSGVQPGPFMLSYLREGGDVSASLYAYPDDEVGGGYFLLMAGLPARLSDHVERRKREVTIVVDRSGSMAGEKMDQVRAAALQVIEGLEDGEAFNVIDYATTVESFQESPVLKDRDATLAARQYLDRIRPTGGTNIHDALSAAMAQPVRPGMLPIVLFLTDGLPTVGDTSEIAIRNLVTSSNPGNRRVFTFGVGNDVNAPLLDRIADLCRGLTTYALPGEDVELKVAQVFKRLYGPILSGVELTTRDAGGAPTTQRVREIIPTHLPDLYEDGQLIVFGQYVGDAPLNFAVNGDFVGTDRTFTFTFDLDTATSRNAFVPRLWASRRIAYLVDQIRQSGAVVPGSLQIVGESASDDPRFRELSDEILRLSTKFGILTEYTAFLATEGTDLGDWNNLAMNCASTLDERAVRTRWGVAAVNQGLNFNRSKSVAQVDYKNAYVNAELDTVEITGGVRQVSDRCFFRRGAQWVDGNIVAEKTAIVPDETVEFGSDAHHALVDRLIDEARIGLITLPGDVMIRLDNRNILVRNPG